MTTLYKPVLIESAEQAEALPVGTIAKDGDLSVAVKAEDGHWARTDVADGLPMMGSSSMVGWTALVPIEAEEEWIADGKFVVALGGEQASDDVDDYENRHGIRPSSRYVTPWENR